MFELLTGGAVGGLLSAAIAHVFTTLLDRAVGSQMWLKGPYGPPFFNIALFMGLLYGGIALGLSRRRADVLIGALGPSLGIAVPMAVLTRLSLALPWMQIVIAVFVAAVWGTIFALGRQLTNRWAGGIAACAGAFAGYLALQSLTMLAPGLSGWRLHGYLPSPVVLLDGTLTATGMGLAVFLIRRRYGETAAGR